jgi:PleD family two-component response regulator
MNQKPECTSSNDMADSAIYAAMKGGRNQVKMP